MKQRLLERLKALLKRREEHVAQQTAELAVLDAQIAATQSLVDAWDTISVDAALVALEKAGIRVRLDS